MFDLTPRTVDSTVRELRLAGYPIASDPDGYMWATTPQELRDTADGLLRRMGQVAVTRDALEPRRRRWSCGARCGRCASDVWYDRVGARWLDGDRMGHRCAA